MSKKIKKGMKLSMHRKKNFVQLVKDNREQILNSKEEIERIFKKIDEKVFKKESKSNKV
ncbi:hypothetical protein PB1_10939 [Bacillus methanolicus PB1]|uniref:FbpB family small basic protein n=1 Tax=Bacillus methanolicus PB1 TaxID=997296 RepID=I3DV01_BACMT|nr:FbpB family small basic protein [Bacillus methanolicus]EIJ78072.1 hypothetical protein PB1_10939 [Bacillus methanolicus PB1]